MIPAVGAAVEGVHTCWVGCGGVFIGTDVVVFSIVKGEGRVLDAVGVPAGHAAKVRVNWIDRVIGSVVEAEDDVTVYAVLVGDEEVGDGGAVGDEGGCYAWGEEPVFT